MVAQGLVLQFPESTPVVETLRVLPIACAVPANKPMAGTAAIIAVDAASAKASFSLSLPSVPFL
jgi:hypothetical protein